MARAGWPGNLRMQARSAADKHDVAARQTAVDHRLDLGRGGQDVEPDGVPRKPQFGIVSPGVLRA